MVRFMKGNDGLRNGFCGRGSVEIGAAHEIMAAGAAEFAFFVVEFVAATGTPAPMFAGEVGGGKRAWGGGVLGLGLGWVVWLGRHGFVFVLRGSEQRWQVEREAER
jgi:hypothetical protein